MLKKANVIDLRFLNKPIKINSIYILFETGVNNG